MSIQITADWICFYCYKPATGNLPNDWDLIWQSPVCPDCLKRAKTGVTIGGEFAYMDDPRED